MDLIFFSSLSDKAGKCLQSIMDASIPPEEIEIYHTIDRLAGRLRRPLGGWSIAVILTETREALEELLALRALLASLRILLILPDRSRETVAKGHTLRPRFLTYADSDFSLIAEVLKKMRKTYLSFTPEKGRPKRLKDADEKRV